MLRYLVVLLIATVSVSSYSLQTKYAGNSFFDGWSFFTAGDPTHGEVNYVSEQAAKQNGYIGMNGNLVYIGCDHINKVSNSSRGRNSVRITSNQVFNYGLFIMDLTHMPTGCGTWPAWWLVGPNWPSHGEIDIIEGIDLNTAVGTTLHTSDGCNMQNESTSSFTGHWGNGSNGKPATNCFVNAAGQYNNQGCGIVGPADSYGAPFNKNGGGVYALEWTTNFIRAFYFTRNNIPGDIQSADPNPNGWGKPYAYFQLGPNCSDGHFNNQQIVINLTFCGDYAGGNNFKQQCPNDGNCNDFVKNNPQAFSEAYWAINYINVYH